MDVKTQIKNGDQKMPKVNPDGTWIFNRVYNIPLLDQDDPDRLKEKSVETKLWETQN